MFLIFNELISAGLDPATSKTTVSIAYMIDQSHCIEPKVPAMFHSVMNIQTAHAKALLVNREELKKAQDLSDVLAAEAAIRDAFEIDVKPLLESIRQEVGVTVDPMVSYLESGYEQKKFFR